MQKKSPAKKISAPIEMRCYRVLLQMGNIVFSADGTGNKITEAFEEFSCCLLVAVRWFGGIAESRNMDCIPEKRSPCFGRDMHSICVSVSSCSDGDASFGPLPFSQTASIRRSKPLRALSYRANVLHVQRKSEEFLHKLRGQWSHL